MSGAVEQVHGKFKVFVGQLEGDHSISTLAGQVEKWVAEKAVAPKSIGIEYVESVGKLILTLGYRDDEPGYAVRLTCVPLEKVDHLDQADLDRLEKEMAAAAARQLRIICHELFITATHDFHMVFMTQAAG